MTVLAHARRLASATPDSRNRYVDFLRAGSILMVVVGHWLVAAPYVVDGELTGLHLLAQTPWTHWLTWLFQVMPVFFMVGGYSNAVSWRTNDDYGTWLMSRLRRLLVPTSALVATWALLGVVLTGFGVEESMLRLGSQAAVIPVWFLAVYVVIVAATPLLTRAWDRWGWGTVAAMAAAALAVDLSVAQHEWLGWINFAFVWAAVAQVGVAWQRGRMTRPVSIGLGLLSGAALALLVSLGGYPIAMVGVPGAIETNNSPPTMALLAFGLTQSALLLAIEPAARRALASARLWTGTVLVNGMIMTLYLWHMTAMVLMIAASLLADGVGLGIAPGTGLWWATRPMWLAAMAIGTIPLLAAFRRFDKLATPSLPTTRSVSVLVMVAGCVGLALLAGGGIGGPFLGINAVAVALVLGAVASIHVAGRRRLAGR